MRARRAGLAAAVAVPVLLAVGCGVRAPSPAPAPMRTCLVLSVAGPKGMAIAGAVEALRARGARFDCVYGNSMGAVVGALYAADPSADLGARYRDLVTGVEAAMERDLRARHAGLLPRLKVLLTGKRPRRPELADPAAFEAVLSGLVRDAAIEDLPIPFATSHAAIGPDGARIAVVTRGKLAEAVRLSAANPRIFDMGPSSRLDKVDPGLDRLARVPITDACARFGPARLVVVNASGGPSVAAPDLPCPVHEVAVDPGADSLRDVPFADAPARALYQLGVRAVSLDGGL